MALATKCPHCNTIFRVAADQLKLRGGIVRCGSCQEVFDGNAALLDHAAPAVPAPPLPIAVPAAPGEPVYALDFDTSYDPFGTLPGHAQFKAGPEPEPEPEPELPIGKADDAADAPHDLPDAGDGRLEPWFDAPDDAHQHYAASLGDPYRDQEEDEAGHDDGDAIAADGAQADAPDAAGENLAQDTLGDAGPEPETGAGDAPEPEEPAFVKQSRRRQRSGKLLRILMAAGSVALLVALLAQGVTTFRNQLAAQVPQLKPVLVSICGVLGCRVELPAQLDMVSIEQGELQTLSERTFSYATVLHNQSGSAQAWPSIELVLNDAADKPVLRRVIAPREYLPPAVDVGKGFAPRSEQAVKLYFELAQLKASGYHIAVFYP